MENLSFPKKLNTYLLRTALAIAAVTTLAACPGNKGGGSDPQVNPLCATTCAGITGPAVLINQANSTRGNDMKVTWQLVGDSASMATMPPASTLWGNYIGPVIARGGITVVYPPASCPIPVGQYTFDTVSAGSIRQGGSLAIPILQANGPVVFTFSLTNALVYFPVGSSIEAIYGTVSVMSVNGVSCGNLGTIVL